MKRYLISLAAGAALSAASLYAQDFQAMHIHFDQPVGVANNELPAGDYTISLVRSAADEPVVHFQSDTGTNVLVAATPNPRSFASETAPRTAVVLNQDGPIAQVTRIEVAGDNLDLLLPTPIVHEVGTK